MFQLLGIILAKPQRRRMILVLAGMTLAAALEMIGLGAIPAFVGLLIEPQRILAALPACAATTWLRGNDLPTITLLTAFALAAFFLAKNLFLALVLHASSSLVEDIWASLARRLFSAYLHSPYTFHLQHNPAKLINTLINDVNRTAMLIDNGMRLLREGLVLVVVFVLLLWLDPLVSLLVMVLMGAASGGFYVAVRRSLARRGQLVQTHWARFVHVVNQGLGAIKEAKVLGRESHLMALADAEALGVRRHELFQLVVSGLPRLFLEVLAVATVLCVAGAFVLLGRPVHSTLPVLSLLAVASVRLVPSLSVINMSLAGMRYYLAAFKLVGAELAAFEKPAANDAAAISLEKSPPF